MSRKPVKLCPEDCRIYHDKKFVADQLGVSVRTLYDYIKDGLKASPKGTIYCPEIRKYYDPANSSLQESANPRKIPHDSSHNKTNLARN